VPNPTIEEMKEWDEDELLEWFQQSRRKVLKGDQLEKFKAAHISGGVFLKYAGDANTFEKKCGLAFGVSETLADIAAEIVGTETAGMKGKFFYTIYTT